MNSCFMGLTAFFGSTMVDNSST